MSAATPAVSVVIPTYGHARLIPETLSSVFDQTHGDLEVIVVNDGSPDDVGTVLAPLVHEGRIRYVEQENQGQSAARNRGLALATGRYVAFLDDDDLWPADKLSWQVGVLAADPGAVCVYGTHVRCYPDGRRQPQRRTDCPSGDVRQAFRLRNWLMSPGQALFRTETVRAVGGFDSELWGSDDWDLYLRLAERGRFLYRDRPALLYRVHDQNASRQAVRHARNHWRVTRRHIGWNLPLLVRHQREAARYFVPRLGRFADEHRRSGDHAEAVRADLLATSFRPGLLVHPGFTLPLLRSVARLALRR